MYVVINKSPLLLKRLDAHEESRRVTVAYYTVKCSVLYLCISLLLLLQAVYALLKIVDVYTLNQLGIADLSPSILQNLGTVSACATEDEETESNVLGDMMRLCYQEVCYLREENSIMRSELEQYRKINDSQPYDPVSASEQLQAKASSDELDNDEDGYRMREQDLIYGDDDDDGADADRNSAKVDFDDTSKRIVAAKVYCILADASYGHSRASPLSSQDLIKKLETQRIFLQNYNKSPIDILKGLPGVDTFSKSNSLMLRNKTSMCGLCRDGITFYQSCRRHHKR